MSATLRLCNAEEHSQYVSLVETEGKRNHGPVILLLITVTDTRMLTFVHWRVNERNGYLPSVLGFLLLCL